MSDRILGYQDNVNKTFSAYDPTIDGLVMDDEYPARIRLFQRLRSPQGSPPPSLKSIQTDDLTEWLWTTEQRLQKTKEPRKYVDAAEKLETFATLAQEQGFTFSKVHADAFLSAVRAGVECCSGLAGIKQDLQLSSPPYRVLDLIVSAAVQTRFAKGIDWNKKGPHGATPVSELLQATLKNVLRQQASKDPDSDMPHYPQALVILSGKLQLLTGRSPIAEIRREDRVAAEQADKRRPPSPDRSPSRG